MPTIPRIVLAALRAVATLLFTAAIVMLLLPLFYRDGYVEPSGSYWHQDYERDYGRRASFSARYVEGVRHAVRILDENGVVVGTATTDQQPSPDRQPVKYLPARPAYFTTTEHYSYTRYAGVAIGLVIAAFLCLRLVRKMRKWFEDDQLGSRAQWSNPIDSPHSN